MKIVQLGFVLAGMLAVQGSLAATGSIGARSAPATQATIVVEDKAFGHRVSESPTAIRVSAATAASRAAGFYATSFEAPTFTLGELNNQDGWTVQWVGDWSISDINPVTGTQHARSFVTLFGDSRASSPTITPGSGSFAIASGVVSISNVGSGSTQWFSPIDQTAGLVNTRVIFQPNGEVEVLRPGVSPGDPEFCDVVATYAEDEFIHVRVIVERATNTLKVCLDGGTVYNGPGFAPNIERIDLTSGMESGSQGSSVAWDDIQITYSEIGDCDIMPRQFFAGELTENSPTFFNPGGQGLSGGSGGHHYCVRQFSVDADGPYTIETASPNTAGTPSNALDTFLRLNANAFDPIDPSDGLLATNDDYSGPLSVLPGPFSSSIGSVGTGSLGEQPASQLLNVELTAGTSYFLVQTSWRRSTSVSGSSNGQGKGIFYTGIAGPGAVTIGNDNCPIGGAVGDSRLQFAHLAPFASGSASEVTIRLNGGDLLTNFAYGDSTPYLEVPAVETLFEILAADNSVVTSASISLMADFDYTIIVLGDGHNQPFSLLGLVDDNMPPPAGFFKLRLAHAAPFAPGNATAEVRLADGTVLATLDYGDATGYSVLPVGLYDISITGPGGTPTLIDLVPFLPGNGAIFSILATGDAENQAFGAFNLPSNFFGNFLPLVIDDSVFADRFKVND